MTDREGGNMSSTQVAQGLSLLRLEILEDIRSPRFLLLGLGLPVAIYLAYMVTGIGGATNRLIDGIAWSSYLMVSMAAFGAMSVAIGIAAGRFGTAPPAVRRELARPPGSRVGWTLVARLVTAMLLALSPVLLLELAGSLEGIRLPAWEWPALALSMWLGVLPFIALGLLLGQTLAADTGDVVFVGVVVVLAILGGLFQPIGTFPAGLATLARVLPSYHLADLGWTTIAERAAEPADVLVLAGYTVGIGAVAAWRTRNEDARTGEAGRTDNGTAG
jgi:ABC-2 type transport system permease protein